MRRNYVAIDGDALKNALKKRGLPITVASEELGYSKSFLNECAKENRIALPALKMMELKWKIQGDDIYAKKAQEIPENDDEMKKMVNGISETLAEIKKYLEEICT